jgi:probable H4MPT-linked C1 transfer pathway protein
MCHIIGLDIGGANLKLASLKVAGNRVLDVSVYSKYFPVWKHKDRLAEALSGFLQETVKTEKPDGIAVTMTAELSDAFQTKREGVNYILDCVALFSDRAPVWVLDVDAELIRIEEARLKPLRVAAANWAATGWLAAKLARNCIVIDVGSTSTSIVPVLQGRVITNGKTDLEKLLVGELVYTGSLRTNVAAIVDYLPVKGGLARVSSEHFAQSADVHLILGNITIEDYTCETADGKGKTLHDSMDRLARVVCADTEMLSANEIKQMALYIHNKQIWQIGEAVTQVLTRLPKPIDKEFQALVAGVGKAFLAKKAAEQAGISKITDIDELLGSKVSKALPAVGVALLGASKIVGRCIQWTQC